MSLILEALRKLEQEKRVAERGLVVVSAQTWAAQPERRLSRFFASLAVAALAAAAALALRDPGRGPAEAPPITLVTAARNAVAPSAAPAATPSPLAILRADASVDRAPEGPRRSPRSSLPPEAAPPPSTFLFRLPASPTPQPLTFVLQAISQKEGRRFAILNGYTLFEGEGRDGFKILRIGEAEVELESRGRRLLVGF